MTRIQPERVVDVLERVLRRAGRPLERELAFEQCQARIGYSSRLGLRPKEGRTGEATEDGRAAKPAQAREEMMALWPYIRELHPRSVLEIGSKRGGWCYCMAPTFAPYARIVMIDMAPKPANTCVVKALRAEQYDAELITGDSHAKETVDKLKGESFDLIHIDGDHRRESFLKDWQLYVPLVRSGGLVAVHDAFNPREDVSEEIQNMARAKSQDRVADWMLYHIKRPRARQLGVGLARIA